MKNAAMILAAVLALTLCDVTVYARGGGGCFSPDTPVTLADGSSRAIKDIVVGDRVLAFDLDGRMTAATVRSVFSLQAEEYLIVFVGGVNLRVTPEHPFYIGGGEFRPIGTLAVGDSIFVYDGRRLLACAIDSVQKISSTAIVYNLQVDSPNTFFASGVAVHNKGGGRSSSGGSSHSSSHRSSSSSHGSSSRSGGSGGSSGIDNDWLDIAGYCFAALFAGFFVVLVVAALVRKKKEDQNLDYLYSPREVVKKNGKTVKLLEFIARQDASMTPGKLSEVARNTFAKLQECWWKRNYEPMRPLMMPYLHNQHCQQIAAMVKDHEINVIDDLRILRLDLVNVRYTIKPEDRQFTALITASARDYYLDDRDDSFLRGDDRPETFQEFWTFCLVDGKWMLEEIEQTRESDALKEENFFEQFTDNQVQAVTGEKVESDGPIGPWLEKGVAEKATNIERALNFLAETDKLWTRRTMLQRAREIFTNLYMARSQGSVSPELRDQLFPDVLEYIQADINSAADGGVAFECRNFCIRKAELILVRNFRDRSMDEFVVRISAHAQRIVRKGGVIVHQDEWVVPFEEFLTLGRLDNQWKLKEIVSARKGKAILAAEN